jgi:hypothetical protein
MVVEILNNNNPGEGGGQPQIEANTEADTTAENIIILV